MYQKHTFGATQVLLKLRIIDITATIKRFSTETVQQLLIITRWRNVLGSFSVYEDGRARKIMSSVPIGEDIDTSILALNSTTS